MTSIFGRTKHGLEIDFVLYGPRGLLALEVKRATTVNSADLRALKEFRKDYPQASCTVLYGGEQPLLLDGIRVVPITEALRGLTQLLAGNTDREPTSTPTPAPRA